MRSSIRRAGIASSLVAPISLRAAAGSSDVWISPSGKSEVMNSFEVRLNASASS